MDSTSDVCFGLISNENFPNRISDRIMLSIENPTEIENQVIYSRLFLFLFERGDSNPISLYA